MQQAGYLFRVEEKKAEKNWWVGFQLQNMQSYSSRGQEQRYAAENEQGRAAMYLPETYEKMQM